MVSIRDTKARVIVLKLSKTWIADLRNSTIEQRLEKQPEAICIRECGDLAMVKSFMDLIDDIVREPVAPPEIDIP